MKIHRYLNLDEEEGIIVCTECDYSLCEAHQNYKEYSALTEMEISRSNNQMDEPVDIIGGNPGIVARRYCCPNCGILFDYQFALEEWEIIHDTEIDIDEK